MFLGRILQLRPSQRTPISDISYSHFFTTGSMEPQLQNFYDNPEIRTVFNIINTSTSSDSMKKSLEKSGVLIANDLIDGVLKRVRFRHSNPTRALEFFDIAASRKGFYHTQFSLDTILYVLGRGRRFEFCWRVLNDMRKKDHGLVTTKTLNVMLGRTAKVCSVDHTVACFWKFKRFFSKFDTSCFNALLRTLSQEKTMVDVRIVYHQFKHQFQPDLQTFNILLSGWKSSEDAEEFFEEMKQLGVKPDLVSYNCLIDVLCKNRELEKAYKIIETMKESDIYPDVFTYTSMIGGLGLIGQPDKARDILKDMSECGCYPDVAAYNAAIRNFCIAKRLPDGFRLMDEIVAKGMLPDSTTFNLFFRCFYWANDMNSSWELYRRMKSDGCLPNTQTCMFLLRLSRRHENVDLAIELWNDMVEKGFGSLILASDVLFDLLCDLGKLADAERCFMQMVDKNQKPSNVSFRRIKVLLELAGKMDSLTNLSEKMAMFGNSKHLNLPGGRPRKISR
ncbi:putative Pentatricopeptide repeat-containing protein [Zostera marina]|uniref:Putative Pentatricopeptide repeat-containing protein n=1 Tax=Zostera marina TaxID=29655 RepID=A0A0K9NIV3_ZOSMR|nr:putative Pentatricopeptide repeat-containing protein [Zostera marina]